MSTLTISAIQTELFWEEKQKNFDHFDQLINQISEVDIIVLPEMFNTGFSMEPSTLAETEEGESLLWMISKAQSKKCAVVGSLIAEEEGKYYNRLYWINPDGSYLKYDKRHLFRMTGEDKRFTMGCEKLIVDYKGWKINPFICYDLRFPVWTRNDGTIDLQIFIANWPSPRAYAWKTLLAARAIENQCFVIGLNRIGNDGNNLNFSGDSRFIDPWGTVVKKANGNHEEILTYTVDKKDIDDIRVNFPAFKDADGFEVKI